MGQHKHNPTAIAAKNGEIKPRKKVSKTQQERTMKSAIQHGLRMLGILPVLPHIFDCFKEREE